MISILFDLDGTLIDTSEGIIKGIETAEQVMSLVPISYDTKKSFIGPPLIGSFERYYSLNRLQACEAVKIFRRYYSEKGKYEATPYKGIPELLQYFNKNNARVFVATSKPTEFAIDIISHFDMRELFVDVVGSNMDNTRSSKEEVIQFILDRYSCAPSNTVMVGDKYQDIDGAKKTGIHSVGVTYGFGSADEIQKSLPERVASTVDQILLCINNLVW